MAPASAPEEPSAHKRKGEFDEHGKRKRPKRDRSSIGKSQSNDSTPKKGSKAPKDAADTPQSAKKKKDKKDRKDHKNAKNPQGTPQNAVAKSKHSTPWTVSQPMGGRILNIDPILSPDEQYLILAYNTSIQVYSAEDSLLLRKIQLPLSTRDGVPDQIVAVCPSSTNPDLIWVASYHGHVWKLNYIDGSLDGKQIRIKADYISGMTAQTLRIKNQARDILFVSATKHSSWEIVACDPLEPSATKSLTVQRSVINNISSVAGASILAASTDKDILLGSLVSASPTSFDDIQYEFFALDSSDDIACLDLRVAERVHLNRESQRKAGSEPVVDVVVGGARGGVYFYNDLLPQLRLLQDPKNKRLTIQPRKYHWHRKAVHSVKWSRDGNYIISGGSEATLVLWQLDTSKLDFLPHLSASIENIVVSADGSAYVLHLNDNSAMVLSTAEMKPTCYVSGVQTLVMPRPFSKDELVRRVGQYHSPRIYKIPAAINPQDPSRISFCVGSGQEQIGQTGSGPATPFLQTVDLGTMQNITKQALTRANPTDNNTTSQGYTVTEPRVTNVAFSRDGTWLATVDEWQPPSRDVSCLDGSPGERREVHLKFWSVSSDGQTVELISRINGPHASGYSEPVFDIASDPSAQRFATVGEDGVVRFWQPNVRQRDGVLIKSRTGRQLQTWSCARAISVHEVETVSDLDASELRNAPRASGAVTFSEDGSTLVCAFNNGYESAIHVIDTQSGSIRASLSGLIRGRVQGVQLLAANVIVLSDDLVVYDIVRDEMRYGIKLREDSTPFVLTQLAVDRNTSTFAVSISPRNLDSASVQPELALFTPEQSEAQLVQKFAHPITSVVPIVGSSGFLVLDAGAELWSVSQGKNTSSAFAQPLSELNLEQGDADNAVMVVDDDEDDEHDEAASDGDMDMDGASAAAAADDDDVAQPVVVAPQKLTELFEAAPPFAMPPIEDMFYQVTRMFAPNVAAAT